MCRRKFSISSSNFDLLFLFSFIDFLVFLIFSILSCFPYLTYRVTVFEPVSPVPVRLPYLYASDDPYCVLYLVYCTLYSYSPTLLPYALYIFCTRNPFHLFPFHFHPFPFHLFLTCLQLAIFLIHLHPHAVCLVHSLLLFLPPPPPPLPSPQPPPSSQSPPNPQISPNESQ